MASVTRRLAALVAFAFLFALTALVGTAHASEATDPGTTPTDDGQDSGIGEAVTIDVPPPFDPTDPAQILRDIVFPVVGATSYSPTFGACRDGCTRPHEGIDIMTYGWKGVPVVAAHDGVVTWAAVGGELAGCGAVITADDGWKAVYSHLNTDGPGTDDGAAPCFPAGIEVGARVAAGTIIGWVGDAGNAEETPPHLHFEIHHPEHGPVDPMVSLDAAHRIEHRWIDEADLAAVAPSLADGDDSVLVVPSDALHLLETIPSDPELIETPVVPYDREDPAPAWEALRTMAPERIVVVTTDPAVPFIPDLLAIAAIVEVVVETPAEPPSTELLPRAVLDSVAPEQAPQDGAATASPEGDGEETGPVVHHDPEPDDTMIVVATGRTPSDPVLGGLGDHLVVLLVGGDAVVDIGHPSTDAPGSDANRDGLWWPTADGWRIARDLSDGPSPSIAYVAGADVEPWTLAYLASRDGAPHLPLWHYQPTSLVTRSL